MYLARRKQPYGVVRLRLALRDEIERAQVGLTAVVNEAGLVSVQATVNAERKEVVIAGSIQLLLKRLLRRRIVHIE